MALKKNASAGARAAAVNRAKAGSPASVVKAQNKPTSENTNTINRSIPAPINQSMVAPMKTVNLVDSQNAVITKAQKEYGEASTRGDTAGMLAANARAEGARRLGGTIQPQTAGRTQTFTPAPTMATTPATPAPTTLAPTTTPTLNTYTSGGKTYTAPAGTAADKLFAKKYTPTIAGIARTEDLGIKGPTVTEIGGKPSFANDPIKEKLILRLNRNDSTLTDDEIQLALDYADDKMVSIQSRSDDPTASISTAYDRIQERQQQQIKEQERLRQQTEQVQARGRDTKLGQYQGQLNTIYEPEIQLAQEQGEVQKESVRSILSFSGFGRSTKTVEKLTEVDQNVDQRLRVIEGQKQAEAMRYQAQLEGADAMVLAEMDKGIRDLRDKSNQLNLDSLVKIEELKLDAQTKNDEVAMKQLQNFQANFLQDLNSFDQELSKQNGFLTGATGQPILDESGKIQALPQNYDFGTPIESGNGDVSIPIFDEIAGTFKMVPTGVRKRVPGSGSKKNSTTPDLVKALYGDIKAGNTTYEEVKSIYGQKYVDDIRLYQAGLGKRPTKKAIFRTEPVDPLEDIAEALLKKINE